MTEAKGGFATRTKAIGHLFDPLGVKITVGSHGQPVETNVPLSG